MIVVRHTEPPKSAAGLSDSSKGGPTASAFGPGPFPLLLSRPASPLTRPGTGADRGAGTSIIPNLRPGFCPDGGKFQDNRIRYCTNALKPFAAVFLSSAHGHGDSTGETHEYGRFNQGHGNE